MMESERIKRGWRLGASPIDPSGTRNVSPEAAIEYDQMLEQISRHETAGDTDWAKVDRLGELLLRRDGKDLRIAMHRLEAQGRLHGWGGWSEGLATIAAIIQEHWPDRVFPPPASSSRVIAGLLSRLADRVRSWPRPSEEHVDDAVLGLEALLKSIRGRWGSRSPDGAIESDRLTEAAWQLVDVLEAKREALPTASSDDPGDMPSDEDHEPIAAEGSPEPVSSTPVPQTTAPPPPLPSPIAQSEEPDLSNHQGVVEWMGRLAKKQQEAAVALLAHRPLDPEPYLLLRAIVWSKAGALKIDPDSRKVLLRAPESSANPLADIPETPTTDDLVRTERLVAANPFWLDLTIRSMRMLERMGTDGEAARQSIRAELQALLLRRPDLHGALLPDGRPLLTDELQGLAPLGNLLATPGSNSSHGGSTPVSKSPNALESIGQLRGGRDRFEASLAAIRTKTLNLSVTLDLLESLLEVSESTDLESWDPSLASALFEQTLVVSKGEGERWNRVRNRASLGLARTAPDRLISIRGKSASR